MNLDTLLKIINNEGLDDLTIKQLRLIMEAHVATEAEDEEEDLMKYVL